MLAASLTDYIDLVLVHGPDGQRIYLNPLAISTLREPSAAALGVKYFPHGTRCVVITANGKFVPVQETCAEVRILVDRTAPGPP